MRYMIVDDSNSSRKMTTVALKPFLKDDDKIAYAENGAEAVEKFDEFSPDIIFMDLTMPVMDGFEASERILQKNKNAIIIVISADVQQKTRDKLKEIGIKMFVKKPISKEAMRVAFETIIAGLKNG